MKWVLIIIVANGFDGGTHASYVEFQSRELCVAAREEINKRQHKHYPVSQSAYCVQTKH